MTDAGPSQALEAPLKRKFEEPVSPTACKKLKDCDSSDPASPLTDGTDSFAPPVLATEADVLTPVKEAIGELEASAQAQGGEVVQESEEEEDEEELDDGEVSSEVDSDDNSEEDSDATSDDETAGNSSQNPGSSSKGKEKEDVKGKGILVDDGKGKAKAEDSDEELNDENDAGYLSEDPFDELDLNNILPTRTRRRSGQPVHYDFAEFGDDDDEDDDSDA